MRRALLSAFALFAILAAPAHAAVGPSPGSPGLGDRLFPELGNGGYDALHYDVDLRYATSAPTQPIDGTVTMVARATQALSRFDLDFAGASVGAVAVNGQQVSFGRVGGELVITPREPIRNGDTFLVTVSHYVAVPTAPDNNDFSTEAFFYTPDGSATAGQPNFANYFLPSNDHPSDKATFDFRFDVPAGETAVANGVLAAKSTFRGRTHWVYVQRQPMATELVQLAVGNYDVTPDGVQSGVLVRDVTAKPITARILPDLQPFTGPQLAWLQARVGPYPFDLYGSLVVQADLGFALETQTLELIDTSWFDDFGQGVWEPTELHEMTHMWFGDSVSPKTWSDLWLNEGHASWYEFLYAEQKGELADDTEDYPDPTGYATLDELMKAVYAHGDQWRDDERAGRGAVERRHAVRPPALPRRRARALRAAPGRRRGDVPADRAGLGPALPGPVGVHRRLHRARLAGLRPQPDRVPARLAVRDQDAADAGPSGLEGRPGRRDPAAARGSSAAAARRCAEP